MSLLEVRDLHKHYGLVKAVNGIDLNIREGTCFGLLGPNGAGKSTTIEVIEGIKEPTSGEILFRGQPRDGSFKEKIGIQFQSTALQDYMTVKEALVTFKNLYPHSKDIHEIIEVCQLEPILDRDHKALSGGQRQRLLLGLALINDPELIFLDEPTTGLDPQARKVFWKLVESIKKQNKTIILTTHYMEEAYILCDEIVIVDNGKIIAEGSPRSLLDKHFKGVRVSLPIELKAQLEDDFPLRLVEANNRIEFLTEDIKQTVEHLIVRQIELAQLEIRSHTLEDLFIDLTGQGLRG